MTIKAIIFDLGGVIININYVLTVEAFKSLGGHDFDKIYSQFKQSNLFDRYETGQIDDQAFRKGLIEELDLPMEDEQFDVAWNAMLLDLPKERLEFIKRLRHEGFATFLFSNTNGIHLKKVFEICQKTTEVNDFTGCFDKEYYSHTLGMRKPHKESFEQILKNHNLKASETLFVDDTAQHVEGAKRAGIYTMLIDKNHSIFDIPSFIAQLNKQEKEQLSAKELNQASFTM
ncbi:HAD family phosphatase [uncultured Legionella sp.]|uniref:HAD family hydrolase n=1 Tax=uncultured Legionella sp. TaxID=210934 RepID=UPI002601FB89|nr:HAD family phosphatase [uncultured Legionella sp.]